jgi:hypothetical protein
MINRITRIFFIFQLPEEAEKTQQVAFGESHLIRLVFRLKAELGLLSFFRKDMKILSCKSCKSCLNSCICV